MWAGVAANLAKVEDKFLLAKSKLKDKQSLHSMPKNCDAMVPHVSHDMYGTTMVPLWYHKISECKKCRILS